MLFYICYICSERGLYVYVCGWGMEGMGLGDSVKHYFLFCFQINFYENF